MFDSHMFNKWFTLYGIDGTRGENEIVIFQNSEEHEGSVNTYREWFDADPDLAQKLTDFTQIEFNDQLIALFDIVAKISNASGYYSSGGENGLLFFGEDDTLDGDIYQGSCVEAGNQFGEEYISFDEFEAGEQVIAAVDMMWKNLEEHSGFISIEDILNRYAPLLEDELIEILSI